MTISTHAMLMVIGIQINYTLFGGLRTAIWTEKVENQPMVWLQNDESLVGICILGILLR